MEIEIDGHQMKKRFTFIIVAAAFFMAIIFYVFIPARHANYPAVLEACREMMTNKDSYYPRRTDWPAAEGVYIDFTVPIEATDPKIPKVIRDLQPGYVIIQKDSVLVVFQGGFSHRAYKAFPEGVAGDGTQKLIDGLWLIHD